MTLLCIVHVLNSVLLIVVLFVIGFGWHFWPMLFPYWKPRRFDLFFSYSSICMRNQDWHTEFDSYWRIIFYCLLSMSGYFRWAANLWIDALPGRVKHTEASRYTEKNNSSSKFRSGQFCALNSPVCIVAVVFQLCANDCMFRFACYFR